MLAKVPKGSAEMVAAAVRTIFAQPDAAAVADQLDSIAAKLGRPAVETMLREAARTSAGSRGSSRLHRAYAASRAHITRSARVPVTLRLANVHQDMCGGWWECSQGVSGPPAAF